MRRRRPDERWCHNGRDDRRQAYPFTTSRSKRSRWVFIASADADRNPVECRGGFGHGMGLGRFRTRCGHQNHLPISAAIDGVMNGANDQCIDNRPRPMVVPT